MQITPYLNFDGRCAEAFRFYAELLGGRILMMQTYGESPMADEFPDEPRDSVIHATLDLGGQMLMGSDSSGKPYRSPQGFAIAIASPSAAEADRIVAGLADGDNVSLPLQQTYWAERFGMVTERFGTPWMVSYGNPEAQQ